MRRTAVLGCALLVVAGCGGGGGNGVDQMVTTEPVQPASEITLSTTGEFGAVPIDSAGDAFTAEFFRWGAWGGVLRDDYVTCEAIGCPPAGDTIFWAHLTSETDGTVTMTVDGTRSGTSPASGSAVWSGDVHAYETEDVVTSEGTSVTIYAPVEGDARLEVDFTAITLDVEFTNFDNSQADMSWGGLALDNGEFGGETAGIEGSFYGPDHEGAAGTFARDGLAGVFGALRSSD
ncbi:MAG: hypothetical protein OXP75_18700 [Rhodospirillales bacterium]|nr:hypothetical protein [Rhodospirillales bacterium]